MQEDLKIVCKRKDVVFPPLPLKLNQIRPAPDYLHYKKIMFLSALVTMHCQRKHPYFDFCYSSLTQYVEIDWSQNFADSACVMKYSLWNFSMIYPIPEMSKNMIQSGCLLSRKKYLLFSLKYSE